MANKRRILHLTYGMGVGGTEQVITQLVNHLDDTRFENSIACIEGEVGLLGQGLRERGVEFLVFKREPGFDVKLIKQLGAALKQHKFDIIHCHQYTPFVYGVMAAFFSKTKVVFTEHGRFHPDSYSWKRRVMNPLLGRATSAIVAISGATAQALAHYEWFARKSIEVVYNGISIGEKTNDAEQREMMGINAGDVVFGTITRFDTIKNLPMMIDAFQQVCKDNTNARLLLVGDGEERQNIETRVKKYDLQDKVIFAGYQKDTQRYMSVIDVYLLTSFSEGTSMTLLEAMAMGVCSIVTAVGGNVEIIEHGVSGITVASEDVADLSGWMAKLAGDRQQRELLGDGARRVFAERFSVQTMIRQYSDIYDRILPD